MVRSTRLANFVRAAALATVVAAGAAGAAVILEDGFTDPVASHDKWVNNAMDIMTHSVGDGSCTLTNTSPTYAGEYLHTFSGTAKPQIFTISYVEKSLSVSGGASLFFCRASALNGYALAVSQGAPVVYKYVAGNGTPVSPPGTAIDMKPSNNKFTVSKMGSEFHVFVNDVFQFKFNDTQYASGDVSFMVNPGASVVIGDFLMTDEFTEGKARTWFQDNFNGNGLKYWDILGSGSPVVEEADGVMKVRTGEGDYSWAFVDLELTNFAAKVEVSHKSGGTSPAYGIVLIGENTPGQTIPMVYFGIRGDRKFGVWKTGSQTTLSDVTLAIKGAGAGGLLFVDTIEVKKMSGSSTYEFFANGTRLTGYPVVDFKIVGIGVFCEGNLEVAFDNFSVRKEGSPLSINRGAQISRRPAGAAAKGNSHVFYDLRGRKRYVMTATQAAGRMPVRAAGVYVNESGREVRVSKGGGR